MTYVMVLILLAQAFGLLVGGAAFRAAGRADRALELAGRRRFAA